MLLLDVKVKGIAWEEANDLRNLVSRSSNRDGIERQDGTCTPIETVVVVERKSSLAVSMQYAYVTLIRAPEARIVLSSKLSAMD